MASLRESLADNSDFQKLLAEMPRSDGRKNNEPRPIRITPNYTMHAAGSILVETGKTKVICTASVEEGVPPFLRGSGGGWLTAEYGMLPGSTSTRKKRDTGGKIDGRTQEIQRLIGRSLRTIINLKTLGERTVWIDCDVIQADGGTRTASITGGFVALILALRHIQRKRKFNPPPVKQFLSAISVGIVNGQPMLDLKYDEDSKAEVDANLVMLDDHTIIEIQGTGETKSFTRDQLNTMLDYAESGLAKHFAAQKEVLGGYLFK